MKRKNGRLATKPNSPIKKIARSMNSMLAILYIKAGFILDGESPYTHIPSRIYATSQDAQIAALQALSICLNHSKLMESALTYTYEYHGKRAAIDFVTHILEDREMAKLMIDNLIIA